MAEYSDWYPRTRAKRRAMYANFLVKIVSYQIILGLTQDQIDRLKLICKLYITIYDWLEQAEVRLDEYFGFQHDMENGDESEAVNVPPDIAPLILPVGAFKGFVREFRQTVGLIKKLDGYTEAIGLDLMIVRQKGEKPDPATMMPLLDYMVMPGFRIITKGTMQGMKTIKFFYQRKGSTEWIFVGYLNRLPGDIHIPPAAAGQAEVGMIRGIFADNNVEIGQFSDSREVTLS